MSVLKFRNPNYVEGGTDGKWITLPTGGGIEEAPEDGNQYVRQDGKWAQVEIPESGIEEAPIDGNQYARQDGVWTQVEIPEVDVQEAPMDEKIYGRQNGAWVEVDSDNSYDLSIHDIYGNDIQQTTANCYIIKEAGVYKFPLVYGNALKNGEVNSSAYTKINGWTHDFVAHDGTVITTPYIDNLVEYASSAQLTIADTNGVFTNITIIDDSPCRYVQFEVTNIPNTGANGIISIKNSSGVIMWNWHIWVWNEDMTPIEVTNATNVTYKLLPYNLASKWDDDTKTYIKNWYYQFGRPTPMICPSAYDSTTDHATYGALSFSITSTAPNIQTGIQNPATFYKYTRLSYNDNWFATNSNMTYNLWDADCTSTGCSDNEVVKTVYDPSPVGFKMPNGNTFTGFSIIGEANGIVKLTRYSGDTTGIGIPMLGFRSSSDGLLSQVGSNGYVWSSAAYSQDYAYRLWFTSSNVYPQTSVDRAHSLSVRPVEE